MAKIDDDMLKFYCNEDLFLLEVHQSADKESLDIILIEHEEYSWAKLKHKNWKKEWILTHGWRDQSKPIDSSMLLTGQTSPRRGVEVSSLLFGAIALSS